MASCYKRKIKWKKIESRSPISEIDQKVAGKSRTKENSKSFGLRENERKLCFRERERGKRERERGRDFYAAGNWGGREGLVGEEIKNGTCEREILHVRFLVFRNAESVFTPTRSSSF